MIGPTDGTGAASDTKMAVLEKGRDGSLDVDVVGPLSGLDSGGGGLGSGSLLMSPRRTPSITPSHGHSSIAAPTPLLAAGSTSTSIYHTMASPAQSSSELRPPTPAASKPSTPNITSTQTPAAPSSGSVFALPYRMLYAVLTMDTIAIYDTQQASPVCMLTKLHYDEFTDLTWFVSRTQ